MSVIHLHPEELLDEHDPRAAAHVAECDACRLTEQLRRDFAEDTASVRPEAIVEERRPPRQRRRPLAWSALAVLVVVTFFGAAALAGDDEDDAPARAAREVDHARRALVVTGDALRAPPASIPKAPPPVDVGALFREAGARRMRHDYAGALGAYRALLDRHPGTPEARAALVIAGRMLLDGRDPSAALPLFDAYLRGREGGAMREEALVGRAMALDASARSTEGREAWRAVLRAYPISPYAGYAVTRVSDGEE